jgi:hypothetical protein
MDVDLDEGAGELFRLPRRGGLARAQTNDHVLPAHRLPRLERHVLNDAVALVEDSEHRNPLRHRRDPTLARGRRRRVRRCRREPVFLLCALPTGGKRQRHDQRCSERPHVYSGIHGS